MKYNNYKSFIEKWLQGLISGNRGIKSFAISSHVRRWLFEKYNGKCQKCGWNEINPTTGLCPLQVHHIDGNWENTVPDNLELLCPNCHSLTPNIKKLNTGNGRKYRKLTPILNG